MAPTTAARGTIGLEDTEVCALLFGSIENLVRTMPALQHNLHQMMSMEFTPDQSVIPMRGCMHAEERRAVLQLNLADRYRRHGCRAARRNCSIRPRCKRTVGQRD